MFQELELKNIRADGWVQKFLLNQLNGLTGNIDKVGPPFSVKFWENVNIKDEDLPADCFLGGIIALDDAWVPFEQNGYWIDGLLRAGILTDNEQAIEKAKGKIMPVVENADADGYLGARILKDKITWAHSIYFRALTALYDATGDEKILDALKNHYLRAPLKDVFEKQKNSARILYVRNIADIEVALWLYGKTNDKRFLDMAEQSYQVFNDIFVDDTGVGPDQEMKDLTIKGMLGNRKVQRNHGVTYCEICKLPAILYMYTGKEIYKKAAINAFEKLYRDQMIIDGVNSSTEYLNGVSDSNAMHETCDISDLTWALGYLYMITGDPKYGDRIENAIFNAGLGCVDDEFKGEQYFSCPNQVICNDTSNHAYFYRGEDWMSYAPKNFLACCAGNVHRFMPNFAIRSWLINQEEKELFAATYAPSKITAVFGNDKVSITERTEYPFNNKIEFVINGQAEFTLTLRVPAWAVGSQVKVNNEVLDIKAQQNLYKINRKFNDGDIIEISFEDRIELIENAKGISVKKGAILYALPVKERVEIEGLRMINNPDYPHYSLYPESEWNFAFDLKDLDVRCVEGENTIELTAYKLPSWKIVNSKNGKKRLNPRGKVVPIGHECKFMPRVPSNVKRDELGERKTIKLVPYGSTRLRIAIFPFIKD